VSSEEHEPAGSEADDLNNYDLINSLTAPGATSANMLLHPGANDVYRTEGAHNTALLIDEANPDALTERHGQVARVCRAGNGVSFSTLSSLDPILATEKLYASIVAPHTGALEEELAVVIEHELAEGRLDVVDRKWKSLASLERGGMSQDKYSGTKHKTGVLKAVEEMERKLLQVLFKANVVAAGLEYRKSGNVMKGGSIWR
jgi:hypothetical protein